MSNTATATLEPQPENEAPTSTARLVVAWVIVGIPLLYGVYETLLRAAKLFTG
ncbi:MAG TPA: hypothetical protein VNO21_19050 [Polyangiaceae bacterium]|nr:hypothetical protein [Polyangiaceae bacterium]